MSVTWWLSYAGKEGFRGVVLVDTTEVSDDAYRTAVISARAMGVSPGGECVGYPLTEEMKAKDLPAKRAALAALPRLVLIRQEQLTGLAQAVKGGVEAAKETKHVESRKGGTDGAHEGNHGIPTDGGQGRRPAQRHRQTRRARGRKPAARRKKGR